MANNVGEKIKLLRVKANLSQEELAKKLYFSNSTISNWEKGLREVSMENLNKLASFFGVKVSYFIDQYSQIEHNSNTSFQQIKYKDIVVSKKYFYIVLIAMFFNVLLIFFPFQARDIPLTMNILFWIAMMIHSVSRYSTLDKQRTKNFLIPLNQEVHFICQKDKNELKTMYQVILLTYGTLTIFTFLLYLSIFGMFNQAMPDPIFSGLLVVFTLFTFFLHINELIRQLVVGVPKNKELYNRENIDFGMYRHRTMVTTHYVGLIILFVFMNALGNESFQLEWLISNLIFSFAFIVALHLFLIKITSFYNKYTLNSDSSDGNIKNTLS
jgi:transcriptional regulator with XRE-family HTH domain